MSHPYLPLSIPHILAVTEDCLNRGQNDLARDYFHDNVPRALAKAIISNLPGDKKEVPKYVVHYTSMKTAVSMLEKEHLYHATTKQLEPVKQLGAEEQPEAVKQLEAMRQADRCMLRKIMPSPVSFRMYDAETFTDPREGSIPNCPDFDSKIMGCLEEFSPPIPSTPDGDSGCVAGMKLWGASSQCLRPAPQKPEGGSRAYILSFSAPTANGKIEDNLKLWRLYGDKGRGCSLKIPIKPLQDYNTASNWWSGLVGVRYHAPTGKEIDALVRNFRQKSAPVVDFLRRHSGHADAEFYKQSTQRALQSFLSLVGCLYKDKQYQHENEFRLVVAVPEININEARFDTDNPFFIRPYVDGPLLKDCLVTDSVLTTGPAARLYHAAAETLHALCRRAEVIEKIKPSRISYRSL